MGVSRISEHQHELRSPGQVLQMAGGSLTAYVQSAVLSKLESDVIPLYSLFVCVVFMKQGLLYPGWIRV